MKIMLKKSDKKLSEFWRLVIRDQPHLAELKIDTDKVLKGWECYSFNVVLFV